MCSRWTLPESTQKLLGQSWKLVYIFGIYLVFLLFCYTECSTKSERQSNRSWTWFSFKKNEKKKKKKKPLGFAIFLLEKLYMNDVTDVYTQLSRTRNWLATATYPFTRYIPAITSLMGYTMSHNRETMNLKSNHSVMKSL